MSTTKIKCPKCSQGNLNQVADFACYRCDYCHKIIGSEEVSTLELLQEKDKILVWVVDPITKKRHTACIRRCDLDSTKHFPFKI